MMDLREIVKTVLVEVDHCLQPMVNRVRLTLGKGTLHLVDDGGPAQTVQVTFLKGETRDGMERPQDYGFTSHPLPGMQPFAGFFGGDRSNGFIIAMCDRTYRIGLQGGEVAMYDDLGQSVHLTRGGIVVKGAGLPVTITDTPRIRMETALLEVTGEVRDRCGGDGRTMAEMRAVYDTHTHPETDNGGPTGAPNQGM